MNRIRRIKFRRNKKQLNFIQFKRLKFKQQTETEIKEEQIKMAKIHMVLQGKGGVGKSMVSALIAQYKQENNEPVLCVDTDPVNSTLKGYSALDVKLLPILAENRIDARQFDILIANIADTQCDVVVDNGASSFIALSDYLISNSSSSLITELGHELIIHTIITGGQALPDTIQGFNNLINGFTQNTKFVVWLNPFWGVVEDQGQNFYAMNAYQQNKHVISAVIELPKLQADTFGRDFSDMLQARKTFAQSINDSSLTIMVRHRLKNIRDQIFSAIAKSEVI